jgi:hypothetical protein
MQMKPNSSAGCLTGFVTGFSRLFLFFAWFARPVAFSSVFGGSWLLPCIGILVAPFTTLMYVLLVTNGSKTISGIDWLWLVLALLIDLGSIAAAGAANRNLTPSGYVPEIPATPPTAPKP